MCDKCLLSDFESYRSPVNLAEWRLLTLHFTNEEAEVEVHSFYQLGYLEQVFLSLYLIYLFVNYG